MTKCASSCFFAKSLPLPLPLPHSITMPPKMLSLGPPLRTRATNKDKHPGELDMLKPRRKPAEVEQSRQQAAKRKREQEDSQKLAVQGIAELEDMLQNEDDERENQRIRRYKPSLDAGS